MSALEVLVALAIAVGVVGVVVPFLPGTLLVLAAVLRLGRRHRHAHRLGGLRRGGHVPRPRRGREVRRPGPPPQGGRHPDPTLLLGAVLGVVGFFVIPVVGLVIGFVLGVYLAELNRVGTAAAWPATVHALKAVGLSMLIELVACLLAAATWAVGRRARRDSPSSSRWGRRSPTASRTSSAAWCRGVRRCGRSP